MVNVKKKKNCRRVLIFIPKSDSSFVLCIKIDKILETLVMTFYLDLAMCFPKSADTRVQRGSERFNKR